MGITTKKWTTSTFFRLSLLGAASLTVCLAQQPPAQQTGADNQINVNWLYGSYVPKEVPLTPMDGHERLKLYLRQTYTSMGIYIKTTLFTIHDQVRETNPEWGNNFGGFAKRFGTRQAEFVVQNSVTSLGDGLLGWEPRYDRCHCDGFWPRVGHAVSRNFVTYGRDEKSKRPQIMPYLGAFAGAALASTWEPGNPNWRTQGYHAAIAQVFIGAGINCIGEFAPEIGRIFHKKDTKGGNPANKH